MIYKLFAAGLLLVSLTFAQLGEIDKVFVDFQRFWTTADKNGAGKLLSEDLIWFSLRGRSLNKQEVLDTLNRRGGMEKISDKKIRLYGNVAVMTFTDGEGSSAARRTVVWAKTQDGWKIVSFHASPIQQ